MSTKPGTFDEAEAEQALQHAEAIEQLREQKRIERIRRKQLREHKEKQIRNEKMVGPVLLILVVLAGLCLWFVSR